MKKIFKKSLYLKKKHHVTPTSYNSHSSLGEKAKLRQNWDAKKPNQATGPGNSLRTFVFSAEQFPCLCCCGLPVSRIDLQARLFSKCNGSKISWRGKAWNSYKKTKCMTYETFLFILKNKILVTLLTYLCTLLYLLPLWQTNKHLVGHSFMEKGSYSTARTTKNQERDSTWHF